MVLLLKGILTVDEKADSGLIQCVPPYINLLLGVKWKSTTGDCVVLHRWQRATRSDRASTWNLVRFIYFFKWVHAGWVLGGLCESACARVCTCVHASGCVCVCVCEREREREASSVSVFVCVWCRVCVYVVCQLCVCGVMCVLVCMWILICCSGIIVGWFWSTLLNQRRDGLFLNDIIMWKSTYIVKQNIDYSWKVLLIMMGCVCRHTGKCSFIVAGRGQLQCTLPPPRHCSVVNNILKLVPSLHNWLVCSWVSRVISKKNHLFSVI